MTRLREHDPAGDEAGQRAALGGGRGVHEVLRASRGVSEGVPTRRTFRVHPVGFYDHVQVRHGQAGPGTREQLRDILELLRDVVQGEVEVHRAARCARLSDLPLVVVTFACKRFRFFRFLREP